MTLRIKKNLEKNKNEGKAMLRLKASAPDQTGANKKQNLEMWIVLRQAHIGTDTALHAAYAVADANDVERKMHYLHLIKRNRDIMAATNKKLGINTKVDDDLLPLPQLAEVCSEPTVETINARKIQADRVVDMDELALEIAMLLEYNPVRLDSLFKKISNAMRDACIKRGDKDAATGE